MNLKVRAAIYLSLAAGIWGGQYAFSSWVLGSGLIGPFTLLALRLAVTSLILGAIMRATRGSAALILRRDEWGEVLRIGIVGYVVSLGAQFVGTKLSGSAYGSLMTSTSPAFIVVFARLLLGQRVSPLRMGAVGLATLGAVAIVVPNLVGADSGGSPTGNLLLLAAGATWGLYTVLSKRFSARRGALAATFWASVVGAVVNLPIASLEPPPVPAQEWPALAWAGLVYICVISTAVAFYLWNLGFELMNADAASAFFFMQPVVGATLGWWLLGEPLGPWFFIGAALIGLGLAASAMSPEPRVSLKEGSR
ncbi:MAG: DMT family transporter [Bacillota bacterium]|nr:DMT family transporter [Bacillota bacterium]